MTVLQSRIKFELFNATSGHLTVIYKLPGKNGFRHAVKNHTLARLREEAKDVLLDSIRDPVVANKVDEINLKKLNKSGTTKLLERKEELKLSLQNENISAYQAKEQEQARRADELERSIQSHWKRLQASDWEFHFEPKFDVNLLCWIPGQRIKSRTKGAARSCDCRYQMRLHSFIASLNTSSDTKMKNDTLALIERCLATGPDDIFTDKNFWG
jgi:hypothetical protein